MSVLSAIGPEWSLVVVTIALVWITARYLGRQIEVAKSQSKLEIFLKNKERYDGPQMVNQRRLIAIQIIGHINTRKTIWNLSEEVANFFDDLGMQLKNGYLDKDLIWSVFGYDLPYWWFGYKEYIYQERTRNEDDNTLYADFELLFNEILKINVQRKCAPMAEPSKEKLFYFLTGQKDLI